MSREPYGNPEEQSASAASGGGLAGWLAEHNVAFHVGIWVIAGAAIAIGTFMWVTGRLDVQSVGYAGALAINLIGSATIFIPVPGLAVVCGASVEEAGLNPALLGIAGGVGSTLGELTSYLAGYSGRALVKKSARYARISRWVDGYGGLTLFVLAVIPNPVFDVAGIAAGSLGYSLKRFLVFVLAGKIVKFVAFGYACRSGIDWIAGLV